MKVCILSGSENPNGNTAIMCDNAAAYLKDMKIKYDLFNLYEEEVDFVAEEIKKYDVVIIATPIHSFYCSDAVKELMDFAFENEDYFDGRRKESGIKIKSAIMVSHGYDEGYAVEPFEIGYKRWCDHVGMEYAGKLAIRDTGYIRNFIFSEPAKKHQEFIKKICGIDAEERSAAISNKRFYLSEASENRRVFERLFNLYIYEISSYAEWMGECMTEDALFIPDKVSEYFEMSEKQPFIIKVKGKIAGLIVFLVPDREREPDEADFYIEELFILKAYRKQHIAEELIEAVWSINKGICSVCALKANKGSVKFWKKVIKKSGYECEVKDMDDVYFYNIKIK